MTSTEKMFLGLVLVAILYLASPEGSSMSVFQWIQYFVGLGSIIAFVASPERE